MYTVTADSFLIKSVKKCAKVLTNNTIYEPLDVINTFIINLFDGKFPKSFKNESEFSIYACRCFKNAIHGSRGLFREPIKTEITIEFAEDISDNSENELYLLIKNMPETTERQYIIKYITMLYINNSCNITKVSQLIGCRRETIRMYLNEFKKYAANTGMFGA